MYAASGAAALRVYFTIDARGQVLLLLGGDKDSQDRDSEQGEKMIKSLDRSV